MKATRKMLSVAAITTALFVGAFAASFVLSGAMSLALADKPASHSSPEGEP
jgi:hypothetical protein